jgi:hypothetical protein
VPVPARIMILYNLVTTAAVVAPGQICTVMIDHQSEVSSLWSNGLEKSILSHGIPDKILSRFRQNINVCDKIDFEQ